MKPLAKVALFVVSPVNPPLAAVLSRASGLLPAPRTAVGVMLGSLNPFDSVRRHSIPPLNACFPFVQLRSSPMEYRGLIPSRHRPNPPLVAKGKMPVENIAGFPLLPPIGMPFE